MRTEPLRPPTARFLSRPLPLLLGIIPLITAVTALAYWNAQREAALSFQSFAAEQVTLAGSVAVALGARLASAVTPPASGPEPAAAAPLWLADLQMEARIIERSGQRVILLRPPRSEVLYDLRGHPVRADSLASAARRGATQVQLDRPAAAALGLPARSAVAGISGFLAPRCGLPAPCSAAALRDPGPPEPWLLAVVASAQRERDREQREVRQLLLWVLISAGLLLSLGAVALRLQREALQRAQELAISAIVEERNERLARAERAGMLGALATGITHEIATPLSVIVARAEQIERRVADDEISARAAAGILVQVHDIERVIRAFLNLARGNAPPGDRVDPRELALGAVELCEHRFARAGVLLRTDIPPEAPPLQGDPHLLRQVLVNLLLNACDACTASGCVTLRVDVDRRAGTLGFLVTDDGNTISAAAAARAAEPFFTTKPAGQGTGLGLAIASEIVKHHGGALHLGPRGDGARGTTARVDLPLARPAQAQPRDPEDVHGP